MSALESALRLVEQGYPVFPVAADKKPLVAGWTTGAARDADGVERLFRAVPDAPCVGVSTGQADVVVADFDPRSDGDATLGRILMEHGDEWQDTVAATTPRGGRHYYFRAGGRHVRTTAGAIGPGVDTRAMGGFVVAPMSVGEHGVYRWVDDHSPDDRAMLPVPDWIATLTQAAHRPKRIPRGIGRDLMQVRDIPLRDIPYLHQNRAADDLPYLHQILVPPLSDGRLREIATDEMVMRYVGQYLGIHDAPLGTAIHCVLHAEDHPSAALFRDRNGVVMYHDFHEQGTPLEWLTLAEVFAAQKTGEVRKLNRPEHATWFIRLLVATGLIDPAPVAMPPMPPGASTSLRKVYEGVRLLFGSKWLYAPGKPSVLSWRFAAGWCGVAQNTAQHGIQTLVRERIIEPVGIYETTFGKTMTTYLPVVR